MSVLVQLGVGQTLEKRLKTDQLMKGSKPQSVLGIKTKPRPRPVNDRFGKERTGEHHKSSLKPNPGPSLASNRDVPIPELLLEF